MGTLRQSNLELLRIVAMLLVLVVHADFLAFGKPDIAQIGSNPCASWLSYWVEAFAIVCVDLFVLLSGYFGIVWRFKSLGAYLFQVLFFAAGICLAYYAAVRIPPPLKLLSPSSWPGYWFAVHYFLLYLIAPVLNLLVDRCSRRGLQILLLLFFLVQTYCWYTDDLLFLFKNGYSVVSFVGLYLFARYIRLYAPRWSRNRRGGVFGRLRRFCRIYGRLCVAVEPFGRYGYFRVRNRKIFRLQCTDRNCWNRCTVPFFYQNRNETASGYQPDCGLGFRSLSVALPPFASALLHRIDSFLTRASCQSRVFCCDDHVCPGFGFYRRDWHRSDPDSFVAVRVSRF